MRYLPVSRPLTALLACAAAASAVLLGSCSPDVAATNDPGWYLNHPTRGHEVVSPDAYMASVGCTPHQGRGDSTTIAFKLVGGSMARFSCTPGTNKDSTKAGIERYRDAVFAATGKMMSGGGDYYYVHTWWTCDIYTHDVWGEDWEYDEETDDWYHNADGDQYLYSYKEGTCWYYEEWQYHSGGPPPGVGGYPSWIQIVNPTNPPPPPPPPPPPSEPVASITLTPSSATEELGGSPVFTVSAYKADGSLLASYSTTWTSSNSAVAVWDDGNTFPGLMVGTTTITASVTSGGNTRSASATLTVTDTPEPPCDRLISGCLLSLSNFPKAAAFLSKALSRVDTGNPTCVAAAAAVSQAVADGKFYYGGPLPDGQYNHSGLTYTDTTGGHVTLVDMHVDGDVFAAQMARGNDGRDDFARFLFHEGLHALGYNHPSSDGNAGGVAGHYSTSPFDLPSDPNNAAHGCLKP